MNKIFKGISLIIIWFVFAGYVWGQDEEVENLIKEYGCKSFTGKAGTNFLENNFAFHKGEKPKKNPRLLLEIIYSRVQTPFSPRKPFIDAKNSEFSNILNENRDLFQKIVIS